MWHLHAFATLRILIVTHVISKSLDLRVCYFMDMFPLKCFTMCFFFSSPGGALSESIGRHKSLEAFLSPGAWILACSSPPPSNSDQPGDPYYNLHFSL